MIRLLTSKFDDFSLFLGPARLRSLFLVIAATGLLSLMLNAFSGDWVTPAQTLLLAVALVGATIIVVGKMEPEDRGRWLALLLPAFGAVLLGLTVLPQYILALSGAAAGWIVAGLFFFRSRGPMEYQEAVKHLRKSEFAEAVKVMDILIKQQPRDANHYRFRAELLRVWGRLDRAKRDYQKMVELEPKSAVAYNGLAEVLLIRTRFYPPTASKTFQKWSVAVVVVSAAITSPLMLIWLLANITPLIIITTLIATTAAGYFAWKYPIHAQRLYAQKDLVEDDYLREPKSPIVW